MQKKNIAVEILNRALKEYVEQVGKQNVVLMEKFSTKFNNLLIIIIVFSKLTVFPCASVNLPSSSTCNNILNTSLCAFSISSNNIIE